MAMKMDVWQWGDVKGVDEELCNNLALFAEDNKIDCMNMTEKEFVDLKNEYLMKNYGNKGVFSKKSLKESKKFHYGEEIIKFLDKYGYNKCGEDFEQKKDYSTVTYMYAIPKGMRPQTPYVEFTVDADNDAFIFGEYFTDGRKGYSTEFDSVEDLEYFVSNANYSNVDLTESKKSAKSLKESKASLHEDNVEYGVERIRNKVKGSDITYYFDDEDCFIDVTEKKSARKSIKEGINDELIATSSDGETTLYLSDERQANHGKDPHYEFKLGENGYFTRYIRCDDNRCENVVLDWIKEFNLDISKSEISKIIKLHELKKFVKKSLKESVDGYIATDEDCNMSGKCWVLDGSYNFIMEFLQEWGIAPKDVKVKNNMTTLYNADGNPFGYVYQDEEVDIFVADKTTNWTWENHNPSTKRVKVTALDKIF